MLSIQKDNPELPNINPELLEMAVSTTLRQCDRTEAAITLRLTNDSEMKVLNKTYRDLAKTTDVLSFNADFTDPETGTFYLGDIVISLDQVAVQAASQGHSLDIECAFLTIHGTLHLLGLDHYAPKEKAEMWALQDSLLQEVLEKFNQEE